VTRRRDGCCPERTPTTGSAGRLWGVARAVQTVEDLLVMLDAMFTAPADRSAGRGAGWWDTFYADRTRGVPFFRPVPDESLVAWHQRGLISPRPGARALDLGCGPGRNAVWLAGLGYQVDAVDLSPAALAWGREHAAHAGVDVSFVEDSIFDQLTPQVGYDLVVDSGCFHHLPPHRRISYRQLLERALAPGGWFGLSAFAAGAEGSGSDAPDDVFYREGSLGGGVAYTAEDLRASFGWLTEIELRRMHPMPDTAPVFGVPFLWAGLFRNPHL